MVEVNLANKHGEYGNKNWLKSLEVIFNPNFFSGQTSMTDSIHLYVIHMDTCQWAWPVQNEELVEKFGNNFQP